MNQHLENLLHKYPELSEALPGLTGAFDAIVACYRGGGKLLICGNGGSAADSEHLVGELMKGYLLPRSLPEADRQALLDVSPDEGQYLADHLQGALPAISLVSQVGLITAFMNDVAADMIFAQQVYGYGRPGDVLIGISTSGNARNVLNAVQVARSRGLRTLGFTGSPGGRLRQLCDIPVSVAAEKTADVQERHLAIYHALCAMIEEEFFTP